MGKDQLKSLLGRYKKIKMLNNSVAVSVEGEIRYDGTAHAIKYHDGTAERTLSDNVNLSAYLLLTGGVMSGALNMGGESISNVGRITMSGGHISLGGYKCINGADGVDPQDYVTYSQAATVALDYLKHDGTRAMTGNLDIGGNAIINLKLQADSIDIKKSDGTKTGCLKAEAVSGRVGLTRYNPAGDSGFYVKDNQAWIRLRGLTSGYVFADSGASFFGLLNMHANKITALADPTANQDGATKIYVDTAISNLIDSSPVVLDTLNELAAALGDDPNFATTVTNSIATKLALAGGTMSGDIAMDGNKLYFDNGGNTYIYESTSDNMSGYAGGQLAFKFITNNATIYKPLTLPNDLIPSAFKATSIDLKKDDGTKTGCLKAEAVSGRVGLTRYHVSGDSGFYVKDNQAWIRLRGLTTGYVFANSGCSFYALLNMQNNDIINVGSIAGFTMSANIDMDSNVINNCPYIYGADSSSPNARIILNEAGKNVSLIVDGSDGVYLQSNVVRIRGSSLSPYNTATVAETLGIATKIWHSLYVGLDNDTGGIFNYAQNSAIVESADYGGGFGTYTPPTAIKTGAFLFANDTNGGGAWRLYMYDGSGWHYINFDG